MFNESGYIVFILLLAPYIESAKRLSEYVQYYEHLNYDSQELHHKHVRAKRSVTQDSMVHLNFHAHNRPFNIRLKRDLETFGNNLVIHGPSGKTEDLDTSHIYHGHLEDEPGSHVFGSISNGVFEGKIVTKKGSFFVERAYRYFPKDANHTFHSVIYTESDIEDPYEKLRTGHVGGCGITDEIIQWMDRIQNSAVDEEDVEPTEPQKHHKQQKHQKNEPNLQKNEQKLQKDQQKLQKDQQKLQKDQQKLQKDQQNLQKDQQKLQKDQQKLQKDQQKLQNDQQKLQQNQPQSANSPYNKESFVHNKYSREANEGSDHIRNKRAAQRTPSDKNTCSLFIQTDPLIWRHIAEQVNFDDEKTREEILSLIAHHVTAVNYIYRDTKFDGRVQHRNIKFEVQRIKIDDDKPCQPHYRGDPNPFCMENIDVSNFLNLHSLGNHEDFCLAYVFTYRDFTGGTLGLAWVASASGASGGICEKYKTYTETIGGLYQSTKRSLNTGIITFVNYNSRVPPKVSQLTLAHEIGHNFGSPHDYPPDCRPGGLHGNFIMFASATSGDRPNNSKFSNCSIGNISNVLDAIEENKKRNCFTVSEGAFCGNKIVEAGEECDCGYDDIECTDKCCYPRQVGDDDRRKNESAKGCYRRTQTQCSPSQGPCCSSETCHFVPEHVKVTCKQESDCSWSSMCNGRSPECPTPNPKANKTRCNEGTQLCINGECTGSICLEWNMTECFLTSHIIPNIDKRKLCELACMNGTDINTCQSTSEFAWRVGLPDGGISLRPGSPCDNFQGYCDVFYKCRAVDAEGPLARLKNLLFNKQTLLTVAQWITENWWAVLLIGIAFIIFMGLFIKCCAVHTPSSNPKKPPARRFSETLRRPMNTLRIMRQPYRPPPGHSGGPSHPGPTRGPAHGYGEGRASAPPSSYSRSNHPELYAGAYGGRNAFEMRHHKV